MYVYESTHMCAVLREGQCHVYFKLLCVCVCVCVCLDVRIEPMHTCAVLREGQLHAHCNTICVSVCLDVRIRANAYVLCVQIDSVVAQHHESY